MAVGNPVWSGLARAARRFDAWVNGVSGYGHGDLDRRVHAQMMPTAPLPQTALEGLYTGSDTVARIVDKFVSEMLREPVLLPEDTDGELALALEDLEVTTAFKKALSWMRLHGGSLVLIGADDGAPLSAPLDLANTRDVTYLSVYSRWEARVATYYDDPEKPHYEQPQLYELYPTMVSPMGDFSTQRYVHESRIIRFDQYKAMPKRVLVENNGWSPGVIDRIHTIIRDFDASYEGMALLLTEYVQNVYKIQDFAIKSESDDMSYIMTRLAQLNLARSGARAVVLDAEHEELERKSPTGVNGLADLIDRIDRRMAMAADMPVQMFAGEAAGGLGSGGAADSMTENFYNGIRGSQTEHLSPAYRKLLPIVARAKGIADGRSRNKRIKFGYKSLWQPSDLDTAKAHEHQSIADMNDVAAGILKPHEVAKSRYGNGRYSYETTLDATIGDDARVAPTPPAAPKAPGEKTPSGAGSGSASAGAASAR